MPGVYIPVFNCPIIWAEYSQKYPRDPCIFKIMGMTSSELFELFEWSVAFKAVKMIEVWLTAVVLVVIIIRS
jgi:hypothetical protein